MKVDFAKFERSLPYASELYGVYQPLLGWKARRTITRIEPALQTYAERYTTSLAKRFRPVYEITDLGLPENAAFSISPASPVGRLPAIVADGLDSVVARRVEAAVNDSGGDPEAWSKFTSVDALLEILNSSKAEVLDEYRASVPPSGAPPTEQVARETLERVLARESIAAGVLGHLHDRGGIELLMPFLGPPSRQIDLPAFVGILKSLDPRTSDLARATVSPIGIIHLFRQYFFEFDSFLGPSVQHIWLSPGGTVELVEVSTRKTLIERAQESTFETLEKSEKSSTSEDEISDAVRRENGSNTKLGISLNTKSQFAVGSVFTSQVTTGTSYDIDSSQKDSRELTHRGLRQQTEKLSSEIRKSFKSTFRTTAETTDVTSRRYVIQNSTETLLNYELRRKYRQVGVQLQDIGTELCWQTYVDEPGEELGLGRLVHVAQPSDLAGARDPALTAEPAAEATAPPVLFNYEYTFASKLRWRLPLGGVLVPPPPEGYIFKRAAVAVTAGPHWEFDAVPIDPETIDTGDGSTEMTYRALEVGLVPGPNGIEDNSHPSFTLAISCFYKPSRRMLNRIRTENDAKIQASTIERERAFREALVKAARERIKAAGQVQPRNFEDLREEERVVIYRTLIRQLLEGSGVDLVSSTPAVRHIFAELVKSMFDVDKMLYFVAPEWWVPRALPASGSTATSGPQEVGLEGFGEATGGWGGFKSARENNYMITEESTPARVGSSLGWILQLDGDNLRNAFLNAPWVKAIIPIRPGKEWKAFAWLSADAMEGADGLNATYEPSAPDESKRMLDALRKHAWDEPTLVPYYAALKPEELSIRDAIRYLIVRVQIKQQAALEVVRDPGDPTLNYLPTDRVFEHGFDPLGTGFTAQATNPPSFEVFDQWIDVLPTDQIVPVEVAYDPKTGMQI